MKAVLSRAARGHIDEAAKFYAARSLPSAIRFIDVIHHTLALIQENHRLGEVQADGYRSFPVHNFPFSICYVLDEAADVIKVVAVCDHRCRPDYWRSRVEEATVAYRQMPEAA